MSLFLRRVSGRKALPWVAAVSLFALLCWVGVPFLRDTLEQARLKTLYKEISALCLQREADDGRTVPGRLRQCVRDATEHNIDAEFYANWKNPVRMTRGVLEYLRGTRPAKMHFECSTRSGLLIGLLRAQGYQARDVILIKPAPNFPDHVTVEVWDAQRQAWEVQDPTYNIYYRHKGTRAHLSAEEILAADVNEVIPCRDEDNCGWSRTTKENLPIKTLRDYWDTMARKDADGTWQIYYDADGFDPYHTVDQLTYCEKREKFCKNPPLKVIEPKPASKR